MAKEKFFTATMKDKTYKNDKRKVLHSQNEGQNLQK
jgi:hypothetical protein